MSVLNTLEIVTRILENQKITTARLDTLILLEDATGKDRGWLLAHPEFELTLQQELLLKKQIERRANHEPLAYIRGKSEFYGREFFSHLRHIAATPRNRNYD